MWEDKIDYTDLIKELKEKFKGQKLLIVTDSNIMQLYLDDLQKELKKHYKVYSYIAPPGERAKDIDFFMRIQRKLETINFTREDGLIALGGGAIGDLVGFCASTYYRGMKYIYIPTTLLAQVDSSIGGKNGINHLCGKNKIGTFYEPDIVFTDTKFLYSLSGYVLYSSMAEIIKYGIIYGGDFFDKLNDLDYVWDNIDEIVKKSQEIKKGIVKKDFQDKGIRQILNLGHSFGHIFESISSFKLSHGDGVAMGIKIILDFSLKNANLNEKDYKKIINLLEAYDFDLDWEKFIKRYNCDKERLFDLLKTDKKVRNGKINLVLVDGIGKVRIEETDLKEISLD